MGISAEYPQKYPQNKKIQKNFAGRGWREASNRLSHSMCEKFWTLPRRKLTVKEVLNLENAYQ